MIKMKGFLIRCLIGLAAGVIIVMSFFLAITSISSDDKVYAETTQAISSGSSYKTTSNEIVNKAAEIMQYMMDHNYPYSQGNKVPLEANEAAGKIGCDCSTLVCWTLYELGIDDAQNGGSQLSTYDMDTNGSGYFSNHGWTKINSYSDLQAGDIVIMADSYGVANGHVQIFAYAENGVNYYVNCGIAPNEHSSVYTSGESAFYSAWRLPK